MAVKVTLVPAQTESDVEVMPVGAVEKLFTIIRLLTQAVVLQVPSIRAKYVVVDEGLTVMLLPLPAGVPPQLPVYQRMAALLPKLPPFNRKRTLLPMQIESSLAVMLVGALEKVFTFIGLLTQAVLLHVPSIRT